MYTNLYMAKIAKWPRTALYRLSGQLSKGTVCSRPKTRFIEIKSVTIDEPLNWPFMLLDLPALKHK